MDATTSPTDSPAGEGDMAAEPHRRDDRQIEDQEHAWGEDRHQARDPDRPAHQLLVGFIEALRFVPGADEGLDHPHPGEVFLENDVEPVEPLLDPQEQRLGPAGKEPDEHDDQRHEPRHDQGEPGAGENEQDAGAERPDRRPGEDAQRQHHDHLHRIDVAGRADDEFAGLQPVEIFKGKGLHLADEGAADIGAEPHGGAHREVIVGGGKDRGQERSAHHDEGRMDDYLEVVRPDPLIDDPLRQARDEQVRPDHAKEQEQGDGGPAAVRPQIGIEAEERFHRTSSRLSRIGVSFRGFLFETTMEGLSVGLEIFR